MHTIKDAEVALHGYADFPDVYHRLSGFLGDVYQDTHMHSGLGYLTPTGIETHWLQQTPIALSRKLAPP